MQFKEKAALRDTLVTSLNSEELRDLSFDVGVDYDALPGDTEEGKARELILYMERSGRVDQILSWLNKNHPEIDTDALAQETASAASPPAPDLPPLPGKAEPQLPTRRVWKYVDLAIRVEASPDGGYTISTRSPQGEVATQAQLDIAEPVLAKGLSGLRAPTLAPASLQSLGARLFDFLFADEAGDLYQKTLRRADRNLDAVRLRLSIGPVELSRLPWECLYDPRLASFLAVRGRFALTHTVDVSHPAATPAAIDTWRVLLLLSSPENVPPLNLEREQALIERALSAPGAEGRFKVDVLTNPTLPMVREALRQQAYHIVHYTGHGVLSEKDTTVLGMPVRADRPYLVLSDAVGQAALVDDTSLAQLLASAPSVRLVFLNTQAGPGEALLRAGELEAAVSMRYPITDRAASVFAREFYQGIADQLPMEMVFTQARIALYQELGAASRDWVSPVLTTRDE
ncbi:MAG: CHAT domain-containing protein [Anaerolineae bacterium]|nr:CHAT domain-containing protein [Anaerolineae bacterium]